MQKKLRNRIPTAKLFAASGRKKERLEVELNDLIKRSFDLEPFFNLKMAQLLLELVYTVLLASICVDKHLPASVRCQK